MARLANNPAVSRDLSGHTKPTTCTTSGVSSNSIELDFVKRRFLQQNKVLATKNSELMARISKLEDQLASAQSDNLSLRNAEVKVRDHFGKSLDSLEIDVIEKFESILSQINRMRRELSVSETIAESRLRELKEAKIQEIRNREQQSTERWKRRRRSLSIRAETVDPQMPVVIPTPEPERPVVNDLCTPDTVETEKATPKETVQEIPRPADVEEVLHEELPPRLPSDMNGSPELLATPPQSKGRETKAIEIQSSSPEQLLKPKRPIVFQDNIDPLSMPTRASKRKSFSPHHSIRKLRRKSIIGDSSDAKSRRATIIGVKRSRKTQREPLSQMDSNVPAQPQNRDETPADSVFEFMETTVNADQENLNRQRRKSMSFRRTARGIEEIN
ncbi:hypothetical protein KL933_002264 [Ogataea haglerorum]|uniref:Shugoshin n=1 Tax=Ogataea haglerorum TaxID=1937702 RepID=A0AAN6D6A9_9ASCO|nr:uncharacterized protein KL911_002894 [Ogataea haglerorum]KAG7692629.1 hypothetical protein KL951_004876 [Ogataea haglerorum]KAG7702849.1 hypothetical protein KL950_004927 [Ogataea haglerorum]KAG7702946.1 hypothetical protein KL914_004951 [Ogataea haglerorum]KAG7719004.1 hypothetical protein KL913_002002 [Ogataea haglerorum]KAG7720171.1 hypothetical protein KL949_002136 [Ogataea haglerorum]